MLRGLLMNAIRFAVTKKNGAYVATSVEPTHVTTPTRFNLLDLTIVTVFVGTIGGLVWLLVK
jgi:hypothetical protein